MYCKNCGNALNDGDIVCTNCGTPVGNGTNYCANCGTEAVPDANVCIACGQPLKNNTVEIMNGPAVAGTGAKSKMAAGLLGIFLGAFGVHNFYLGYTTKAIIQLSLTILGIILSCIFIGTFIVIGVEIWGLIEGIFILTGKINTDAKGNLLGE